MRHVFFNRSAKNYNPASGLFCILLFCLAVSACDTPAGPGGDPSASPSPSPTGSAPDAPGWVKAEYTEDGDGNGTIQVTWENNASEYTVYRRVGQGSWINIGSKSNGSSFLDSTYYDGLTDPNNPLTVSYAVQGKSGTYVSNLSAPSNATSPVVLDTEASILSQTGGVELTWSAHSEAQSYNVYRFPNGPTSDIAPLKIKSGIAATSGTVSWEDIPASAGSDPKPNLPYFYLVTWVKNGEEFGFGETGSFFSLGTYSDDIDRYEPNDDWPDLPNQTTVFNVSQPPTIFSFTDGQGGTVSDTDWYQYVGPAGSVVNVSIDLPDDTSFEDGELKVQFFYHGQYFEQHAISKTAITTVYFDEFDPAATGDQHVYFKIEPDLVTNRNVIGTYTVSISNEL